MAISQASINAQTFKLVTAAGVVEYDLHTWISAIEAEQILRSQILADLRTDTDANTQAIADEAIARADADNLLSLAIAQEATDRTNADNALSTRLDAIEGLQLIVQRAVAYDSSVQITVANTPQPRLTLNTGAIAAGSYYINLSSLYNHNATNNDARFSIVLDGATEIWNSYIEVKDAAANFSGTGSNQRITLSATEPVTLAEGSHTFVFNYWSENAGVNTAAWQCLLRLDQVVQLA